MSQNQKGKQRDQQTVEQKKAMLQDCQRARNVMDKLTKSLVQLGRLIDANGGKLPDDHLDAAENAIKSVGNNLKPVQRLMVSLLSYGQQDFADSRNALDRLAELDRYYCALHGAWKLWGEQKVKPALERQRPQIITPGNPEFHKTEQAAREGNQGQPHGIIQPGQ